MKPDTITVRSVAETELDADSADLTVVIEGSKVFSGSEAFKKAKEVRELIASLVNVGLEESRIKLRSVEVNSQSFALIKTSSAKYTLAVKTVSLEMLPSVLTAVSSHKGAHLSRLSWNYSKLKETRSQLRQEAIGDAPRLLGRLWAFERVSAPPARCNGRWLQAGSAKWSVPDSHLEPGRPSPVSVMVIVVLENRITGVAQTGDFFRSPAPTFYGRPYNLSLTPSPCSRTPISFQNPGFPGFPHSRSVACSRYEAEEIASRSEGSSDF